MSNDNKRKAFESKKAFERRLKTQAKLDSYVQQGLKREKGARTAYQDRCGHCHGRKVQSNGAACRNCGGVGTITRFR